MDPPPDGCRLCGSTWGDWWEEVETRREFFCCELCARQWTRMLEEVRARTAWPRVEAVELTGNRWGREGEARFGPSRFRFRIAFTPDAELRRFEPLPPAEGDPASGRR